VRSKGESEKENGGGEWRRRKRRRRRRFCRGGDIKEKFSSVQFQGREGGREGAREKREIECMSL